MFGAGNNDDDEPTFTGDPLKSNAKSTLKSLFGGTGGGKSVRSETATSDAKALVNSHAKQRSVQPTRVVFSCTADTSIVSQVDGQESVTRVGTSGLAVILTAGCTNANILLYQANKTPIVQYTVNERLPSIRDRVVQLIHNDVRYEVKFADADTLLTFAKWVTLSVYHVSSAKNESSGLNIFEGADDQVSVVGHPLDQLTIQVEESTLNEMDEPGFQFLDDAQLTAKRNRLDVPQSWLDRLSDCDAGDSVVFITDTPRKPPIFGQTAEDTLVVMKVLEVNRYVEPVPEPKTVAKPASPVPPEESLPSSTAVVSTSQPRESESPRAEETVEKPLLSDQVKPSLKDRMAKIGRSIIGPTIQSSASVESTESDENKPTVSDVHVDGDDELKLEAELTEDVERTVEKSEIIVSDTEKMKTTNDRLDIKDTVMTRPTDVAGHSSRLQYVQVPVLCDESQSAKLDDVLSAISKLQSVHEHMEHKLKTLSQHNTDSVGATEQRLEALMQRLNAIENQLQSPSQPAATVNVDSLADRLDAIQAKLDDNSEWHNQYDVLKSELDELKTTNARMLDEVNSNAHETSARTVRKNLSRVYKTFCAQVDNDMTYSGAHIKQMLLEIVKECAQGDE